MSLWDKGLKMTTKVYPKVMKTTVNLWLDATYSADRKYVFQQDSTHALASKKMQKPDWGNPR